MKIMEEGVAPWTGENNHDADKRLVTPTATATQPRIHGPKAMVMKKKPTTVMTPRAGQTRVPAEVFEHRPAPKPCFVNSKRVSLNFEVNDVGPSGVSAIELWYTLDGRNWQKYDMAPQAPPCVVEVNDEGLYGFTILAKSGLGLGKKAPQAGDPPQVWVEVDLTKPVVRLHDFKFGVGPKAGHLVIRWSAGDKNLGPNPISISYSDRPDGPWAPVATNLENTERYVWQMSGRMPHRFYVRVEATDLAGNVGCAQTPKAILIDLAQPTVSILEVASAA